MKTPKKYAHIRFPGGRTYQEMEALCEIAEREFGLDELPTIPNDRPHPKPRPRGRPPKPASQKALNVMLSIQPDVLKLADREAKKRKLTRAGLIRELILQLNADKKPSRRKSA